MDHIIKVFLLLGDGSVVFLRGVLLLFVCCLSLPLFGTAPQVWSEEAHVGSPFIQTFLPKNYGAAPYNWAVVSDGRGVVYIGNEGYVLEYDGSTWRRIPVSEESSVRALAVSREGTIFVGALGEVGFLAGNARGQLAYVSIKDQLPREHAVFTDIWKACATSRGVYFFLLNKVFHYHRHHFEVIEGDFAPMFGEAVGEDVFVHVRGKGIGRLREGGFDILPGSDGLVTQSGKIVLLPAADGGLMVLTEFNGFFTINRSGGENKKADWTSLPRVFHSPLTDYVSQHGLYSAILLKNRRTAIGTATGGLVVMGLDGEAVRRVDGRMGLPDSAVMGLMEDGRQTIWAAHFNSLARIGIHSPFNVLGPLEGLSGAPETMIRHDGSLYVGTADGAFVLAGARAHQDSDPLMVKPVKGLGTNVFSFFTDSGRLYVTAYDQLARIDGDRAVRMLQLPEIILTVGKSRRFPDHLFVGRISGLSLVGMVRDKDGSVLSFVKEEGFEKLNYQIRRIEEDAQGNVWLSTASHGLIRLVFNGAEPRVCRVEQYGSAEGLPSDAANRAFFWQNKVLAATVSGFYQFEAGDASPADSPRFVAAAWLNAGLGEPLPRLASVQADQASCLWAGSGEGIFRYGRDGSGGMAWDRSSWLVLTGELNHVYTDTGGLIWMATDDGLFSYNSRVVPIQSGPYQTLIRRVTFAGNQEFFSGTYYDDRNTMENLYPIPSGLQPASMIPTLTHRDNSVVFEFSMPLTDLRVPNQYHFFLEGFSREWSPWSEDGKAVFTNLPPGEYRFRAEARDIWRQIGQPGEFRFRIASPWYNTLMANVAKLLLLLAFIALILWLNSSRQRVARRRLERIVAERTAEVSQQKDAIRQQAEALHRTNLELEKLSIVARETDNAVFIMDGQGGILWVNDAFQRMYGEAPDAYISKRGGTIFECSNNPDIADAVSRCRETGQTVHYETLFNRVDGSVLWSQTTLTPIRDDAGRIVNLIAIDSDITRVKTAEIELLRQARDLEAANEEARIEREAAQKANNAKSEFLARMSHEIRTPMNGVLGFTEMLLDSKLTEEQRNQLQLIYRSGESLVALINDILDFSKIEAGEMVFEAIDFDPEVTVFDVCDLISPRLNHEQVELLCQIDDQVPALVSGDAGRFRQVLVNLLGNAVKFTQAGEIVVNLGVDQEADGRVRLHLTVRDSGIGIPREKLESIFDLFQQADGSTSRHFGGTGLGLAICRQIATAMGGRVWAESVPGQGSTFHFTAWLNRSARRSHSDVDSTPLEGRKILVVDDNPNHVEIMAHILRNVGVRVLSCDDPKDVISILVDAQQLGDPVELCVLDIQMPGKSGFELLREIRLLNAPQNTMPVLAFSSSLRDRAKRFREAGFNGFLPKPVRRKRFLSMISHLLEGTEEALEGPSTSEIATQHSLMERGKRSTRILLVEDNPVNQALARFIFDKGGYQLTLAASGEAALNLLAEDPKSVDLIFMDIQMPGMDGRETTRRIRAMGLVDLPIIAMTAESMAGDREACLAAGMNDYMAKPVKRSVIFEMVRKWVLSDRVG